MAAKRKPEPKDKRAELVAALRCVKETQEKLLAACDQLSAKEKELDIQKQSFVQQVDAANDEHTAARRLYQRLRRERFAELLDLHPELLDIIVPKHKFKGRTSSECVEECVRCRLQDPAWRHDVETIAFEVSFHDG